MTPSIRFARRLLCPVASMATRRRLQGLRSLGIAVLISTGGMTGMAHAHDAPDESVAFHVTDICTVRTAAQRAVVDCTNKIMPNVEQRFQANGLLTVVSW